MGTAETLFICYASPEEALAENLRERLHDLNVPAWVYSIDRTAGRDSWAEIEERIRSSRAVAILVCEDTIRSTGQRRELEIALAAIRDANHPITIVPLVIDDVDFALLPEPLNSTNGFRLERHHAPTIAQRLAEQLYPETLGSQSHVWRFPRPGEWLEICALDEAIDTRFAVSDRVYFRRISPMGFFECYCPQVHGLFWFLPANLRTGLGRDPDLEDCVPPRYRASRQFEA